VLASASAAFGNISLDLQGVSAEARIHRIDANDAATGMTIGAITVMASGAGASASFEGMSASAIGAITVTTDGSANVAFASFSASATLGNITITTRHSGDTVTFTDFATTASGRMGDIVINATAGSDVAFGDFGSSGIGLIKVAGEGAVTFGSASGNRINGIDLRGVGSGGSFTIDLSGVSAGVVVDGGLGTSSIVSSKGDDEFYLESGRGAESIRYQTASQGTDIIVKFEAGTADDQLEFVAATFGTTGGLMDASGEAAVTAQLTNGITAAYALTAGDTVIVLATGFDTNASALDFLDNNITFKTALAGEASMLVVYGTGTDTVVAVLDIGTATSLTTLASGSAVLSLTQVAVLSGVTPGALVAANFEIV